MGELDARDWLGFCAGKSWILAEVVQMQGKTSADGNEADGNVGRGREEGVGADADGSPMGATRGDWREEKLDGLGVVGRVCCGRARG